jgi:hypothetical protein
MLFYLKEHGFITLDSLARFDFDELLFVPGISESLISEAKQIYSLYNATSLTAKEIQDTTKAITEEVTESEKKFGIDNSRMLLDEDRHQSKNTNESNNTLMYPISSDVSQSELLPKHSSTSETHCLNSIKKTDVSNSSTLSHENNHQPKYTNRAKDALITQIYSGVPRCAQFIRKCLADNKTLMSQLTDADFDNAVNLRGIGPTSAEHLRKVYHNFINSPHSEDTSNSETLHHIDSIEYIDIDNSKMPTNGKSHQPKLTRDALITQIYSGVPRCAQFIRKCLADNKTLMSQLTEADFDNATNLKGIGLSAAEKLRKVYHDFYSSPYPEQANTDIKSHRPILVKNLPLSRKARNSLRLLGVNHLDELLDLDILMRISDAGTKTLQEILNFREKMLLVKTNPSNLYYVKNINSENAPIPISLLRNIGLSAEELDLLQKNNLETVGDLVTRELTQKEFIILYDIDKFFSIPVTQRFTDTFEALEERTKLILSMRYAGATLAEIGSELQITRERVRQILLKAFRKLKKIADLVAGLLLSTDKKTFHFSDLIDLFHSEELATYCKLVLQESSYVRYFKFLDSFIKHSVCGSEPELRLKRFASEIIGEGVNFYDNLELIEAELKKRNLDFLNVSDIMSFLIHNKYRFFGDFVAKRGARYAIVCHDAVLKYFHFDIKLDGNDNNEDMRLLRQIINKHYHGLSLPSNNWTLTAGIVRDTSLFVLSGRGRYCPVEKVVYNIFLFEDIFNFVHSSPQPSFYYSELFSYFQGRLLAETNIDNAHFLHGMFKYLYPNEFVYERDLMSKIGISRQNIDDRLSQLLLENGRAMSKEEIRQSIPGINDFVIAFAILRQPHLLQWDYNEYNHINNIVITDDERETLSNAIKNQTDLHSGYSSDTLLFASVKESCKDFLLKNNIVNSQNLYYVVSSLFGDDYRFRRPHILSKDFPVQEISSANIIQALLPCDTGINYEEFHHLADTLGWSSGTVYSIFSEVEKNFIRISENDYVRKTHFRISISQSVLNSVSDMLQRFVSKSGYYAFGSIFDYESFPDCAYKWNGFLLESLIIEYDLGFRIITPQIPDRRFQRGIIVPHDSPYETFEDLVIGNLSSDGISTISEAELLKYLRMRAMIFTNTIPQELYECPNLHFKNEIFTIKRD